MQSKFEKSIKTQITANISSIIRKSGIKIHRLAKIANLPRHKIYSILYLKKMPNLKTTIKLSKALNISMDELIKYHF